VVDQRRVTLEDINAVVRNLGRHLDRPAAVERRDEPEQPPRVLIEQVVAPRDRVTHRPLAGRQVARTASQDRQPL
jgi:hypothetical protein